MVDSSPLTNMGSANLFSQPVAYLRLSFEEQKLSNLMVIFSFAFCVLSKKYLSNPRTQRSSIFSSRGFIVLVFMFRPMIYLRVNF